MRELKDDEKHFLVTRSGKEFILYAGLVHLAHEDGLTDTNTDIVGFPSSENNWTTYVKAVVTLTDQEGRTRSFTGHGDCNPDNAGRMIAPHSPRMAETRALARAFRVALDVGYTAFEELGELEEDRGGRRQLAQDVDNPGDNHNGAGDKVDIKGPATDYTLQRIRKNLDHMGRSAEFAKLPELTEMKARTLLANLQNERARFDAKAGKR